MAAPTIPPAAVLARLRTEQARLFTDSASVSTTTYAGADNGSFTRSSGGGTTVACNVTPLGDSARRALFDEHQLAEVATHTIRFPYDTTVGAGDRVTISTIVYRIVGVNNRRANQLLRECYAVEVGAT